MLNDDRAKYKRTEDLMTTGILYIAIGERWCQEASAAAAIVKKYMPHLPITLFADRIWQAPAIDQVQVMTTSPNPLLTRTRWMGQSPYERTLFLDTDITLCDTIEDLFWLLDRFDLAVPHAPYRLANMGLAAPLPDFLSAGVPACFPGLNAGMILFKRSPQVSTFFTSWADYHERHCGFTPKAPAQPAFRTALYRSELRFAIVPEEYHCRFIYPFKVSDKVKVLHGRHPNLESVMQRLNHSVLPRVGEGYLVEVARQRQQHAQRRLGAKVKALLPQAVSRWLVHWRPSRSANINQVAPLAPVVELPADGVVPNGGIVSLL